MNINNTKIQITFLFLSLIVYIILYFLLKRFKIFQIKFKKSAIIEIKILKPSLKAFTFFFHQFSFFQMLGLW